MLPAFYFMLIRPQDYIPSITVHYPFYVVHTAYYVV